MAHALRAATVADGDFLRAVYAASRAEELSVVAWDDAQKQAFIEHQFSAQDTHYRQNYPGATFEVIEVDGRPAGRLYLHRGERDIRIMDIALLPEFRGQGVGTALLDELIEEARSTGRVLSIHVEMNNPARSLYDRLGFEQAGEHGIYLLMEWRQAKMA